MVRQKINRRMKLLEHKHIIIRAEVLDPPRAEETTSEQVKILINDIGMKIMMGPCMLLFFNRIQKFKYSVAHIGDQDLCSRVHEDQVHVYMDIKFLQ